MGHRRSDISKGRGALSNPAGRFETQSSQALDDGWGILEEPLAPVATTVLPEPARTVIARNDSPDVPFEQSINPYRGCEHGCVYCYARPSHAYVNLSPGLDFETRLFFKQDAARVLERELARPAYRCSPISLGANTDPYQPIERQYRVTRSLLEVLLRHRHPATIVTKSSLVLRDLDLLVPMAGQGLARVFVSITTLDDDLKRRMEPRASGPAARLATVRALAQAGVPVGVLFAPLIPGLNDHELERVLEQSAAAGALDAAYILLRLPHELRELFREWLDAHSPAKAGRVRALLRELRGGRDNDPRFGARMTGQGTYARLLSRRLEVAKRRLGLDGSRFPDLNSADFVIPGRSGPQLELFGSPLS